MLTKVCITISALFWRNVVAYDCNPSAEGFVPADSRIDVPFAGGSKPLGIWGLDWAEAAIQGWIFKIFASEVLGYNTEIHGPGSGSFTAIKALANLELDASDCTYGEAKCKSGAGPFPGDNHLAFAVWRSSSAGTEAKVAASHPSAMPENLGSIGYEGLEGAFLKGSVVQSAVSAEGLSLDFYRGYNLQWHKPRPYFKSISVVNASNIEECSTVGNFADANMAHYRRWFPDDTGGVELNAATDTYMAKCEPYPSGSGPGKWWLAPECRSDSSKCIPFTTIKGWGIHILMQKATAYKMPLALASVNKPEWLQVSEAQPVLSYWFKPDTDLLTLNPTMIIFPKYKKGEHDVGNMATANDGVEIMKWASVALSSAARDIHIAASRFNMAQGTQTNCKHWLDSSVTPSAKTEIECKQPGIDNLLMLVAEGDITGPNKYRDAACAFIKHGTDVWKKWVPAAVSIENPSNGTSTAVPTSTSAPASTVAPQCNCDNDNPVSAGNYEASTVVTKVLAAVAVMFVR